MAYITLLERALYVQSFLDVPRRPTAALTFRNPGRELELGTMQLHIYMELHTAI